MRIGILGTRGIPNNYGGFEQFAQHLSLGLVRRGHQVAVYNSSLHSYKGATWNGVDIIHCRDWENKIGTAGQFFYDLNCINDSRNRNFDVLIASRIYQRFYMALALAQEFGEHGEHGWTGMEAQQI